MVRADGENVGDVTPGISSNLCAPDPSERALHKCVQLTNKMPGAGAALFG
jgi:hypothetical protein